MDKIIINTIEETPCGKTTMWFPKKFDTNRPVQPQKMTKGWKFWIDCTFCVAKSKALISFVITAKLICVFVFSYADCWFSHDAAQINNKNIKATT